MMFLECLELSEVLMLFKFISVALCYIVLCCDLILSYLIFTEQQFIKCCQLPYIFLLIYLKEDISGRQVNNNNNNNENLI